MSAQLQVALESCKKAVISALGSCIEVRARMLSNNTIELELKFSPPGPAAPITASSSIKNPESVEEVDAAVNAAATQLLERIGAQLAYKGV